MYIDTEIVSLYAWNEQSKSEIKKTLSFIIASKRVKYLGIKVTNQLQNLNSQNYKIHCRKKRNIEILNGNTSSAHKSEVLILLRWQHPPKCTHNVYNSVKRQTTQF